MKITKSFIESLNQLSKINPDVKLDKGNVIELRDEDKRVIARFTLDVDIPIDAGIRSTATLLQVISLFDFDSLDIEFTESCIKLSDGNNQAVYKTVKPEFVNTKPRTGWDTLIDDHLGDPELNFALTEERFDYLRNTVRAIKASHVALSCKEGSLKFLVSDASQSDANSFSVAIAEGDEFPDFHYVFETADFLKVNNSAFNVNVYRKSPSIILENKTVSFILPTIQKYTQDMA